MTIIGRPEYEFHPRKIRSSVKVIRLDNIEQSRVFSANETELIRDYQKFTAVVNNMVDFFSKRMVNKILAKTTTGMIFGAAVAEKLNLPLIVAGEIGKMPGQTIANSFKDEHSNHRVFAIDGRLVKAGDRIGLVNNMTYSGTTIAAIGCLVEETGGAQIAGIASAIRYSGSGKNAHFKPWLKDHDSYAAFTVNKNGEISFKGSNVDFNYPDQLFHPTNKDMIDMIRIFPNFPYRPVMWTEYNMLLADPNFYKTIATCMAEPFRKDGVDVVLSLAVRGLHFGTWVANALGVGQVIALKPDKLHWPKDTVRYEFEYGRSKLSIPKGAIEPGQRVLIVDDILATGGTAAGGVRLVQKQKGKIAGIACALGLPDVMYNKEAFQKLTEQYRVLTLLNLDKKMLREKSKGRYF